MQTLEIRKYVFGRFVVIFVIQVCHVGFALSFYWHVLSFCCHVVVIYLSFMSFWEWKMQKSILKKWLLVWEVQKHDKNTKKYEKTWQKMAPDPATRVGWDNDKKMTKKWQTNCFKKMQQNSNACDNKITKNNTAKHKKITNWLKKNINNPQSLLVKSSYSYSYQKESSFVGLPLPHLMRSQHNLRRMQ